MTAIGTPGATGTGITVTPALQTAHASGAAVLDHAGPSGLIVKAVVDHADGTRETFVSDGTWKISKANEFTNATITTRNGDSGDRAERYDARAEQPGWDTAGFDDAAWQPAYAIGAHPRPLNRLRETFCHLDPAISQLEYETIHPKTITTLADGSIVADFGHVCRRCRRSSTPTGRPAARSSSRRASASTTRRSAAAARRRHDDQGRQHQQLRRRRQDHGRPGRQRLRQGRSGDAHDHRRRHGRRDRHRHHARPPLSRAHANARFVEGSRAGTSTHDTQGSNLGWW